MKKAMKLVWMVLFALPMISLTACGDDDDLIDDNNGTTVELKDYSDLIGKKYTEVLEKLGTGYSQDETNQFQIVYYDYEPNVEEIDVAFTFYEPEDDWKLYEKAVCVNIDVTGFTYSYLQNRMQKLYGDGTAETDEDGKNYYTYEKSGKYILLEYSNGVGEIAYFDKSEFDKVYGTKAVSLKEVKDAIRARK